MIRVHSARLAIAFTTATAAAVMLLFSNELNAQVANYAPKVGEPHADFILPSIDGGEPLKLSSYRGNKVLLMHFASW